MNDLPLFIYRGQVAGFTVTRVKILDEAIWITLKANTFGKVMNPTILPPAMGK